MLNPKATPPSSYFHTFWWYLDVALKKHCARAGIPVPPRGYWAKRQANKRVIPTPPLPPKSNGGRDEIVIGVGRTKPKPQKGKEPEPKQQSPEEAELSQLIQNERSAATKVHVLVTLSNPHPIVAKWIEEDRRMQALWGVRYLEQTRQIGTQNTDRESPA